MQDRWSEKSSTMLFSISFFLPSHCSPVDAVNFNNVHGYTALVYLLLAHLGLDLLRSQVRWIYSVVWCGVVWCGVVRGEKE